MEIGNDFSPAEFFCVMLVCPYGSIQQRIGATLAPCSLGLPRLVRHCQDLEMTEPALAATFGLCVKDAYDG